MAGKFNLNDYETVDQRIKRFYGDHANGRIETVLVDSTGDVGKTRWIVKSSVFVDKDDQFPVGTGFAFEVDGSGMANNTSALENCETSAVGRALANAGYSGDKRATREEMEKVERAELEKKVVDAVKRVSEIADEETLRNFYYAVKKDGYLTDELNQAITARKEELSNV